MSFPAARAQDSHVCPQFDGNTPHVGGAVSEGAASVLIGGRPAATAGCACGCTGSRRSNSIKGGSASVLIEDHGAARAGDRTAHGGVIMTGEPSVLIGG